MNAKDLLKLAVLGAAAGAIIGAPASVSADLNETEMYLAKSGCPGGCPNKKGDKSTSKSTDSKKLVAVADEDEDDQKDEKKNSLPQ